MIQVLDAPAARELRLHNLGAFGLNGLGALLIQAVRTKDFPVVMAVTLVFTVTFIVINLVVDVLYAVVDPRVRLPGRAA